MVYDHALVAWKYCNFFSQNDRSISVINTLDIESLVVIVGMDFKASIINGEKVLKRV